MRFAGTALGWLWCCASPSAAPYSSRLGKKWPPAEVLCRVAAALSPARSNKPRDHFLQNTSGHPFGRAVSQSPGPQANSAAKCGKNREAKLTTVMLRVLSCANKPGALLTPSKLRPTSGAHPFRRKCPSEVSGEVVSETCSCCDSWLRQEVRLGTETFLPGSPHPCPAPAAFSTVSVL